MVENLDKQPKNKNLKRGRWKPGESGNPKGRPRNELSITVKQREMLPLLCPYSKKDETWLEWLADRGLALAGENATYYKELMDRLEGKVVQPIGGQGGGPVILKVVYDNSDGIQGTATKS